MSGVGREIGWRYSGSMVLPMSWALMGIGCRGSTLKYRWTGSCPMICTAPDMLYGYTQNVLLFAERSYVERDAILRAQHAVHGGPPMPWVDADFWTGGANSWSGEIRRVLDAWKTQAEVRFQEEAEI